MKVRLQLWLVVCVFLRMERDEGWIESGGQGEGGDVSLCGEGQFRQGTGCKHKEHCG